MVTRLGSRSVFSLITILVTLAALSSDTHPIAAGAGVLMESAAVAETGTLLLAPEDTSLNIDAVNYSTQPLLMAYTWPDNQIANTIVLKFDLSALPAGATVEQAVVHLALVESDTTANATYTMTAHKLVGMNPIIAAATGYTANGATPWTPSACCYNGVPLAQSNLSAPYALLAVDKTPGFKAWTITTMVREWLASPASNFGLVLNSDATKARDRYRFFASTKHADVTLWPVLEITYSMPSADTTPPAISAVASSSTTGVAARIGWTTDESSDSQVEYGTTTAYGSATSVNASRVTAHSVQLSGLLDARITTTIACARATPPATGQCRATLRSRHSTRHCLPSRCRCAGRGRDRSAAPSPSGRMGVRQRRRRKRPVPAGRREPRRGGHDRALCHLVEHDDGNGRTAYARRGGEGRGRESQDVDGNHCDGVECHSPAHGEWPCGPLPGRRGHRESPGCDLCRAVRGSDAQRISSSDGPIPSTVRRCL